MIALLFAPALAYETDQLMMRDQPLSDILEPANASVDERVGQAVQATNARLQCAATPERTHRVLAQEIHARTGAPGVVPGRGALRSQGFTVYSAWMESDPDIDRISFDRPRGDVFSDVTLLESVILAIAGTNSTFELAGVRIGSDKPEHFWDLGYSYLKRSRWGEQPERAVAHGVETEFGIYGMATSRTFSWADLDANWAGYLWYTRLLSDESEVTLGDDGCVVQVRAFDWSEWVTWQWDEVLNPSQYAPNVEEGIQRHLVANRDTVCASYEAWHDEAYDARLTEALARRDETSAGAPEVRWDPYRLRELCGS